ncbi:MAG: hypothetical protein ACD_2C00079G0003 [uncultured bacterium (gcode 4)]|uniref:Uncharacterized protein n=1 Tax=uncultured bacterium (gcode 4) TaxID=1234023 RepID=K2FFA2_9BACT|nr:MAG: hypothetical protein ACD_2C00079G0003 [uncultured bacterium (gcode 4)]
MKLSEKIDYLVDSNEIKWVQLSVLKTKEQYESILSNDLWMDSRLPDTETETCASVFNWLEFNKEKITSQAVVIHTDGKPIWILSFVITPIHIFNKESRYLRRRWDDIEILDFKAATSEDLPDFIISPAWTKILDEYRWKYTIRWFSLYESIMKEIIANAPPKTGIEAIAQWQYWPENMKEWSNLISNLPVWSILPKDRIDFNFGILSQPTKWSKSTAKFAKYLGLSELTEVCNSKTLWPIFYKRIT